MNNLKKLEPEELIPTESKLLMLLSQMKDENNKIDRKDFEDETSEMLKEDCKGKESLQNTVRYYLNRLINKGYCELDGENIKLKVYVPNIKSGKIYSTKLMSLNVTIALALFVVSLLYMFTVESNIVPITLTMIHLVLSLTLILTYKDRPIL